MLNSASFLDTFEVIKVFLKPFIISKKRYSLCTAGALLVMQTKKYILCEGNWQELKCKCDNPVEMESSNHLELPSRGTAKMAIVELYVKCLGTP